MVRRQASVVSPQSIVNRRQAKASSLGRVAPRDSATSPVGEVFLDAPPPPLFFVRVANKGLIGAMFIRVAATGLKVASFEILTRWSIRAANKGLNNRHLLVLLWGCDGGAGATGLS